MPSRKETPPSPGEPQKRKKQARRSRSLRRQTPSRGLASELATPRAGDQVLLRDKIAEKRRRVEELQRELDAETKALAKLERMYYAAGATGFQWETLGTLVSHKNLAHGFATILGEFCGAEIFAALSCVDIEIRNGVNIPTNCVDLTTLCKRFSLQEIEAARLSSRFRITGIRMGLSLQPLSAPNDRCRVIGDGLMSLDLSNCNSQWGDLVSMYLARCGKLEKLVIDNTNASGSLGQLFSHMTSLRELRCIGCGAVCGEVRELGGLPLRVLDVRNCTGIKGDLGDLLVGGSGEDGVKAGGTLQEILIDGSGVGASLGALEGACPRLRRLRASGQNGKDGRGLVDGDLASLGGCAGLADLHLAESKAGGRLEDLSGLLSLESLCLNGLPGVSGDLAALEKMHRLREASLHNTKVTGDLSRLSRLSRLTELRLHETGVKARKAKRSSGGGTGVFSDLEDLSRLTVCTLPFAFIDQQGGLRKLQDRRGHSANFLVIH